MTQVLQPSRQAAWVTLISPSAPGNAGAGSLRGRAVRPGWADCWILLRQPASAWAFQEMQNRRGGARGGGGGGRPGGGAWWILRRQPASAWAFQEMQNRRAEPRRAGSCPVWIQW